MKEINVLVTGAAGQIGYALLPRLASGETFGSDVLVNLRLVEIPQVVEKLTGTIMELEDCGFNTLGKVEAFSDIYEASNDIDWALLVGKGGKLLILRPLRAAVDEIERPTMHLMQVCKPSLREGTQQVQRRGCLVVGLNHPSRIRLTGFGQELDIVDDIAAVARQFDIALFLGRLRTRLRELASHATDLHHRA